MDGSSNLDLMSFGPSSPTKAVGFHSSRQTWNGYGPTPKARHFGLTLRLRKAISSGKRSCAPGKTLGRASWRSSPNMPGPRLTSSSPANWPTRTSTHSWRIMPSCRRTLRQLNKFPQGPMCACLAKRAFAPRLAGLLTHSFRLHQRRAPARYLVDQNQCGACLHTYLNPYRLYLHLRTSHSCFQFLRHWKLCLVEVVKPGDEQFSLCPYLLAEGPLRPLDTLPRDMPASLSPREMDLLIDLIAPGATSEWIFGPGWLLLELDQGCDPVSSCLLGGHCQYLGGLGAPDSPWSSCTSQADPDPYKADPGWHWPDPLTAKLWMALPQLGGLDHGLSPCAWSWRQTPSPSSEPQSHWLSCAPPTAGPLTQQPVLIHLYSGRRRHGDLQACIEELTWPEEAWRPIVISLDVVLDAHWENVLSPQAQEFWLSQISKGAIHGVIAGPPCETWSVARERYYQTFSGPRPVRDLESLWGLTSLSLREALQVLTADRLLTFPLATFLRMWYLRRWFVLEHPAPPDRSRHPAAPSIWELSCADPGFLGRRWVAGDLPGIFGGPEPETDYAHEVPRRAHFGFNAAALCACWSTCSSQDGIRVRQPLLCHGQVEGVPNGDEPWFGRELSQLVSELFPGDRTHAVF